MSKLRRTLLVGATLAAMSLTTMNAVAQPSDGTATRREVSENWNYYNQSTRVPPAELKAWAQGQNGADAPAAPPADAPALTQPAEPSGEPGWLVISLGILAAAMAVVAGLAGLAAKRAIRTARLGQAT